MLGGLYARIADHLATHNISTYVAYPSIPAPPPALEGSVAQAVELDASLCTQQSVRATIELIRRKNVRVVLLIDYPPWRWAYLRLRQGGVRWIVVYDHTSGERTPPWGLKRAAKWVIMRMPWIVADFLVAVSDYVARRDLEVTLYPGKRLTTIRNGLPTVNTEGRKEEIHSRLGVEGRRPIVVCNCRAVPEKGVHYLLRAFDRVSQLEREKAARPVLLYMGDGPQLAELEALRDSLASKEDIYLMGYRPDAREITEGADLCVVPSVWQDALPLAVLEAMARGKPIVASRVGGVPEMIESGLHGILVPPADETALADSIQMVLSDPLKAASMGDAARRRVAEQFAPAQQLDRLIAILERGFDSPCANLET
jgi:glycosyltransferase involved in cell wall biosynthesis